MDERGGRWKPLRAAVDALAGPDRTLAGADLEVAVLSPGNGRRAFRRLVDGELESLLAGWPRRTADSWDRPFLTVP